MKIMQPSHIVSTFFQPCLNIDAARFFNNSLKVKIHIIGCCKKKKDTYNRYYEMTLYYLFFFDLF